MGSGQHQGLLGGVGVLGLSREQGSYMGEGRSVSAASANHASACGGWPQQAWQ
jgi:hypothetical protein